MRVSTLALAASAIFDLSIAGYVLEDDYMSDFYSNFEFFTGPDPTNGFVKYIDEATARQTNLINASSTTSAHFGVDVQNKTPKGRPSIRLESKKKYNEGLIVLDVGHMPFGCGTWPAFWTLGPKWPTGGEIDILEGVNDYTNNGMTLHTGPGCQIGSDTTQFSGTVTTPNCDVAAEGQGKNVGCSIKHPSTKSYGAGLNQNGGGVYATQWDANAISIYFFPRGSIPADVLGDSPNPSTWGKPAAKFAGACDIDEMFAEQKIVIDTTFCGDWAGSEDTWNTGSCGKKAPTCNEYVRDNPQAFTEAYWQINALKVYRNNGEATPPPAVSSKTPQSSAVPVPVPVPSPGKSTPIAAPPASTNVYSPIVPVPTKSASAPAGPVAPSATQPAPGVPSQGPLSSRIPASSSRPRPSRTIQDQILAPTGKFGMPGWQWPVAVGDVNDNAPSPGGSEQNTTSGVVAPTTTPVVAQPSIPPVPPVQPSAPGPALPFVPTSSSAPAPAVGPVQTVYQTVYVTVPADPAATPAPGANQARKARHIREHRRRWTQHNARL